MTTATIARSAGIAPRTRRFQLTDQFGLAYDGGRLDHVLAALANPDRSQMDHRTRVIAMGIHKAYTTGRMNVNLARHLRETLTPYQVVRFVVVVAEQYQGEPTIGCIADDWLNAHAAELIAA